MNTITYLSHVADTCVYLYTHLNIRTQIHPIAGFLADTCARKAEAAIIKRGEKERERERESGLDGTRRDQGGPGGARRRVVIS